MSHVTKVNFKVQDIGALRDACADLGLEFHEGQKTFKWWGGQTQACDHAISMKGADHEIGVVRRPDGSYELRWDAFGQQALAAKVGGNCSKLCQAYSEKVVLKNTKALLARGYAMKRTVNQQGEIKISLSR